MNTIATETEPEVKPEFHIDSDGAADWYLAKIAAFDAEIALIKAQIEQAVTRLQSDKTGLMNLYHAELEQYIAAKLEGDKRGRKSVIFAHGTCQFRTVPASIRVADATEALAYALRAGVEGMTRRELVTSAYSKWAERALAETGVLLPGVETVAAKESFSLKFGK